MSDLARKMFLERGSLAINTAFFHPDYKKANWWETIFPDIEIVRDMRDKLPERHQSLYGMKPDWTIPFDSLIHQIKQSLKDYFIRNWDSEDKHLCCHSAGYDSRIISGILTELRQERGDAWIGDIHFRCHQPEGQDFVKIMKMQGWREDQYSVWENTPEDHYNLGRTTKILNGFNPLTHQMDFISDIVPDREKKNTVIIDGSQGGEFFCYYAIRMKRVRDGIEYCQNPNINRWMSFFAEDGEWMSMMAYEYKDLLAPFLSYDYLKLASLMPNRYVSAVDNTLDSVRQAILETMSINTLAVEYGHHRYTWGLSEATKQSMADWYINSRFYKDYGIVVNYDSIGKNITGHDGKVWAFSLMYEKVFAPV